MKKEYDFSKARKNPYLKYLKKEKAVFNTSISQIPLQRRGGGVADGVVDLK